MSSANVVIFFSDDDRFAEKCYFIFYHLMLNLSNLRYYIKLLHKLYEYIIHYVIFMIYFMFIFCHYLCKYSILSLGGVLLSECPT